MFFLSCYKFCLAQSITIMLECFTKIKFCLFTFLFVLLSPGLSAQVLGYSQGEVIDNFIVTDVKGDTYSLYDITESGKYVYIEFFFDTAPPCQESAPIFYEFHEKYGCSKGDIFMMSINNGTDDDAEVIAFQESFDGGFSHTTAISNDGGSNVVDARFNPETYPTYCLIGPDNTLLFDDIWPLTDVSTFEATFPVGFEPEELQCNRPFITTWKTDNVGSSCSSCITIPTSPNYTYSYDVDWENDGIYDDFGVTGNITHDYGVQDTFLMAIRGDFPSIFFNGIGDSEKIISIDQWGSIEWQTMRNAFVGCHNLIGKANDIPFLDDVTDLSNMFQNARSFNQEISDWDVSNITNMSGMFKGALDFNQNIGVWDASKVINMNSMFESAFGFDGDIGMWKVDSLENMSSMFNGAVRFNQDISQWNVSNVINLSFAFQNANAFDQDLNTWNVSSAVDMSSMFSGASSFNQDISSWNVSNVINMFNMFERATSFNQNIGVWNVSNVSQMDSLFAGAISFNQNLEAWDLSSVNSSYSMLNRSGLSITNYDSTLIGWANNSNTPDNLELGSENLKYCASVSERELLINSKGWIINGDSQVNEEDVCTAANDEDGIVENCECILIDCEMVNISPINDSPFEDANNIGPWDLENSHNGTTCCAVGYADDDTADWANFECSNASNENAVWYSFTPTNSFDGFDVNVVPGFMSISGNMTVEVYSSSVTGGVDDVSNLTVVGESCSDLIVGISVSLCDPTLVYYVKVASTDDECGEFTITVTERSATCAADECPDAEALTTITPTSCEDGENFLSLDGCLELACPEDVNITCMSNMGPTVWYQINLDSPDATVLLTEVTADGFEVIWSIWQSTTGSCDDMINVVDPESAPNVPIPCGIPTLDDIYLTIPIEQDPQGTPATYWIAITALGEITDPNFTLNYASSLGCIACSGESAIDCGNGDWMASIDDVEVEIADFENFCPGQEVEVCLEFNYNTAGTGNDWLHGIIPTFGSGWDYENIDFESIDLGNNWVWVDYEGACATNTSIYTLPNLCTYENDDGILQLCNTVCNSSCPCSGPLAPNSPLPSGWFNNTDGGAATCVSGSCVPSENYGISGGVNVDIDICFDLIVKSFADEDGNGVPDQDCELNKDLQISIQTTSDAVSGCWNDSSPCTLDPSIVSPAWEINCDTPPLVVGPDTEICNMDMLALNVTTDGGTPEDIIVEVIDNPDVDGETDFMFSGGFGVINNTLTNTTLVSQIVIYEVSSVDDTKPCPGLTNTIEVTVHPQVEVEIASDLVVCDGESIDLTAIPSGGSASVYTFQWDALGFEAAPTITVTPLITTTYVVTVSDDFGCTGSSEVEVFWNPDIVTVLDLELCPGFDYIFNGNIISTPGEYVDTFFNAVTGTFCDSIVRLTIEIFDESSADFTSVICSNDSIVIGDVTFDINNDEGEVLFPLASIYGCDSIVSVTLDFYSEALSILDVLLCEGDSYEVEGLSLTEPGLNEFISQAPSVNGCDSIVQIYLVIESCDTLGCDYTLTDDIVATLLEEDTSVDLLENDVLPDTFMVQLLNYQEHIEVQGLTDEGILSFVVSGDFTEPLVATYEICSGDCDCQTASLTIVNEELEDIIQTNVISPNGDGRNDQLRFTSDEILKGSELWIYNRWGDQVFHMEDYDNSWSADGYAGGIYFYVLSIRGFTIKKTLTVIK